jgi:hypothetical protein
MWQCAGTKVRAFVQKSGFQRILGKNNIFLAPTSCAKTREYPTFLSVFDRLGAKNGSFLSVRNYFKKL